MSDFPANTRAEDQDDLPLSRSLSSGGFAFFTVVEESVWTTLFPMVWQCLPF